MRHRLQSVFIKSSSCIMAKNARSGIAVLDEEKYRQLLWDHKPITDFWRIGKGTADRLGKYGIYTNETGSLGR